MKGDNGMMYKVWANCCIRPAGKRIEDATKKDLDEAAERIFDDAVENHHIDIFTADDDIDHEKEAKAYEKIYKYYEEKKMLNVGDYMIVEAESYDAVSIPDMCGWDTGLIF